MRKLISIFSLVVFVCIFLFPQSIYASDRTDPPTVDTFSGPSSGYVGQALNYTYSVTGTSTYSINALVIYVTSDNTSSNGSTTVLYKSVPSTNCSTTSCTATGTYTPTTIGTFYIFAAISYHDGINIYDTSCNTHPADIEVHCQNGNGKFTTLTVTEAPISSSISSSNSSISTLPATAIDASNNYIFLAIFSILTGFTILSIYNYRLKTIKKNDFPSKFF